MNLFICQFNFLLDFASKYMTKYLEDQDFLNERSSLFSTFKKGHIDL